MGLLSFLKRSDVDDTARPKKAGRAAAESVDDVQQLRLRARRRLIGAAVLVGLAVIIFPLIFESQPRPIPVDLPIDIPRKDTAAPLSVPAPAGRVAQADGAGQAEAERPAPPAEAPEDAAPTESRPELRDDVKPEPRASMAEPARSQETREETRPTPRAEVRPETRPESRPEARTEPRPDVRPPQRTEARPDTRNESARVQAMLDGRAAERKPEGAAGGARFIVQVGAYADAKAAQDVRAKVERLGLKTYTQAVETADGRRIRVRVGPFNSRDEADKIAAKVRGGGLSSAVLTL